MKLFDRAFLLSLMAEFRTSMQTLLSDLSDEVEQQYPAAVRRLGLPIELFRLIGRTLDQEAYSHWKVVGWIETFNDLVYFIDLYRQLQAERYRIDFALQLHTECQEMFYENSYADELFPQGVVDHRGLSARLMRVCLRLAQDVVQQAILFEPRVACEWIRTTGAQRWSMACHLGPNFDRAELPGCLPIGLEGTCYEASTPVQNALASGETRIRLLITRNVLSVSVRGRSYPVCSYGSGEHWYWKQHPAIVLRRTSIGTLTLGPTLVYGRHRAPVRVRPTSPAMVSRFHRALSVIEQAWPEGNQLLAVLTSRIIPLKATGVVSFSYRHQPGLSFMNCFQRDDLDLIDDLIHENSHHHLNVLLRKYVLYRDDRNQDVLYSPWRRSLRPVRGILHATFTFTMGALLFARLSTWASGSSGHRRWMRSGLSMRDLQRARFRCAEEVESVRYSLRDLRRAEQQWGWIPKSGKSLIHHLARTISAIGRRLQPHMPAVKRSPFGVVLRRHQKELLDARECYGRLRI